MIREAHPSFLPIIIGTDLNAYTMATSFYKHYGIKPVLVGKLHMFFTMESDIIQTIHYDKQLTDPKRFEETLQIIADHYSKLYDHLILIGTNDIYINLMIDHQDFLRQYYLFNIPSPQVRDQLFYKKAFYEYCAQEGIDIPKTVFYNCAQPADVDLDFTFPVVVKPSDVVAYQMAGLHEVNKLHFIDNQDQLQAVLDEVQAADYQSDLIIQEYIPGDDSQMWDAVYYGSQDGQGQLITLAQVLLQERKSHLVGAYTALVTRYNKPLMEKLANFLEKIGYTGFANFDIKYDQRDGKFKVFEVNIRQGRSSSYICYNNHAMAQYLVDDLIYHKPKPRHYLQEDFLYSVIPGFVLKRAIQDEKLKTEVKTLIKAGRFANPLHAKGDGYNKHWLQMTKRQFEYAKQYLK